MLKEAFTGRGRVKMPVPSFVITACEFTEPSVSTLSAPFVAMVGAAFVSVIVPLNAPLFWEDNAAALVSVSTDELLPGGKGIENGKVPVLCPLIFKAAR